MSSSGHPPHYNHRAVIGKSPELGSGAFRHSQSLRDKWTPGHQVPTVGHWEGDQRSGWPGCIFFLFGIKKPEVERNLPWMCPPRRPPLR